jgi:N-acetylneuraminic acid mutarotase
MPTARLPVLGVALAVAAATASAQTSGTWTRASDMPTARAAHAVAATTDAIYVLAGTGPDGKPVLTVDRFDGKTWTTESNIPGEGLNAPAAAAIGSTVYLIGGFGTTTNMPTTATHRYEPKSKSWSEAAPLPAPRGGHAAVVLDGRIHVIGGGNSQSTIDDHNVYDPKANAWSAKAKLPRSMGSPAAVVVNGRLYSIGGRSGPGDFGDVYVYDPKADAWRPGPSIEPRGTGGAAFIGNNIYYFGGESQKARKVLGDVLRLDPAEAKWTAVTPMPTPRNFARTVIFKGAAYVIGGSTEYGSSHASRGSTIVERFTPR